MSEVGLTPREISEMTLKQIITFFDHLEDRAKREKHAAGGGTAAQKQKMRRELFDQLGAGMTAKQVI